MGIREIVTSMAGREVRFVAYSCVHVPYEDLAWREWLKSKIRWFKPDFVFMLGDLFEALAASRWDNEKKEALEYEYQCGQDHLLDIRATIERAYTGDGEPHCILLEGNHDANIRAMERLPEMVRSLCIPDKHVDEIRSGHWHTPCPYIRDKRTGVFRLGYDVIFSHGYSTSLGAIKKEVLEFVPENGLYVFGHTHRSADVQPVMRTQQEPLRYHFANPGCGRDLKPSYVERKDTSRWSQGLVWGKCTITKSPRVSPTWEAQAVVYKTYDQWAEKNLKTTGAFGHRE